MDFPIDRPLMSRKPIIALKALNLPIQNKGPGVAAYIWACAATTMKASRNLVRARTGQLMAPVPILRWSKEVVEEYNLEFRDIRVVSIK